jgi:hypothetical protein
MVELGVAPIGREEPSEPSSHRTAKTCAPSMENGAAGLACFQTFGFVVLRHAFESRPLAAEIDRVMRNGLVSCASGSAIRFDYVPMMTAETPESLSLLDRAEAVAATLLGGTVLPTRAKGVRYRGNTPWHTDTSFPIASVGFAAYLEPLGEHDGALRVLPGSHRRELGDAIRALGAVGMDATSLPAHVVVTEPGDVIAFDEHLFHASFGGGTRLQWRADYVRDPVGADEESRTKSYFESIYRHDWDGGYDADRYPTYGPDWRDSGRLSVARLGALGVYELAERQEAFVRPRK